MELNIYNDNPPVLFELSHLIGFPSDSFILYCNVNHDVPSIFM